MLKQISVFAENKKGAINDITKILAQEDVNLHALVTVDGSEFAIVRMIVSDTDKAIEVLKEKYLCHINSVLAVRISNGVGSLNKLLEDIKESNTNINYLYTTFGWDDPSPIMMFHTDQEEELELCLQSKGYDLL